MLAIMFSFLKSSSFRRRYSVMVGYLKRVWWIRAGIFLLVCFFVLFPFTKTGKDFVRAMNRPATRTVIVDRERAEGSVKKEVAGSEISVASEGDRRSNYVPTIAIRKDADVRKTLKGFGLSYEADFKEGDLASNERKRDDSYVAKFSLEVKVPVPATTSEQLGVINPHLNKMLPGLLELTRNGKVSPFYTKLYNNKASRLKREVLKLGKVLTSHNYYDCETMLEMRHPTSGREVFLFQADMDVVTDGSDGDRQSVMPDEVVNSTYYQPFTSYSWKKVTDNENPMVRGWEQRVRNAEAELGGGSASTERRKWLRRRLQKLKVGIEDMRKHSFLIAEHDPFIVISVDKIRAARRQEEVPGVGDYVAVIYEDKIYPAIVGDGGPTFKAGESSLRLAKQINPRATSYHRPVSSLGVTYLVFPGTAPKPRTAPDYDLWYRECSKLLSEIGGLGDGYSLHRWEDTLASKDAEVSEEQEVDAGVEEEE